MSPRKNKHQRAAEAAEAFNHQNPPGTPVHFWPGIRLAEPLKSRTRGEAWALPSGAAVVRVEGRAGGIALSHIEVITAAAASAAPALTASPVSA
ncbi:hypothetical protein [Arthrobacter sp. ES1]|uniref:hypothetical protein n=1 Tax=Arthrobacter sp. ES1 TaxID=1897056 RepID=UPI001CFF8827|nr:hypothetical protein [Arthrobacter sp. ES1]MCB5280560.1 hypothetical protein [Arthrobacter sp. ES1]